MHKTTHRYIIPKNFWLVSNMCSSPSFGWWSHLTVIFWVWLQHRAADWAEIRRWTSHRWFLAIPIAHDYTMMMQIPSVTCRHGLKWRKSITQVRPRQKKCRFLGWHFDMFDFDSSTAQSVCIGIVALRYPMPDCRGEAMGSIVPYRSFTISYH